MKKVDPRLVTDELLCFLVTALYPVDYGVGVVQITRANYNWVASKAADTSQERRANCARCVALIDEYTGVEPAAG